MKSKRQDPEFKKKETNCKKRKRKNPEYKEKETV